MTIVWRVQNQLRSHGINGVRPAILARILGLDRTDVKLALHYLSAHNRAVYISSTGAYRATNGLGWADSLNLTDFYIPTVEQIERAYKSGLENLSWARDKGLAHHAKIAEEGLQP